MLSREDINYIFSIAGSVKNFDRSADLINAFLEKRKGEIENSGEFERTDSDHYFKNLLPFDQNKILHFLIDRYSESLTDDFGEGKEGSQNIRQNALIQAIKSASPECFVYKENNKAFCIK